MDIITSEARRPEQRMILEDLLRSGSITIKEEPLITSSVVPVLHALPINVKEELGIRTPPPSLTNIEVKEELGIRTPPPFFTNIEVKEELGIRTPPPSLTNIEVTDLADDDCDGAGAGDDHRDNGHGGIEMTSPSPLVTDFLSIDLTEDSDTVSSQSAFDSREGNAEPQHSTLKQADTPNTVTCNADVHPLLRSVETNIVASNAQDPECSQPIQRDPHSKPRQTTSESNTTQEPQCLGPFVESSTIKCPKCSVVLKEYYQVVDHPCIDEHIYKEVNKRKLKCFFCEKEYGTPSALKRHLKTYVEKTYVKCSICGMRLTKEFSFKMHALIHTNQWPYRCDICGQGSVSEYHLEVHKSIHTNEKSWMCDVCGAMFHNQARLNGHKIVHLEKRYECDLCFAKFRERYQLKEHKKKVHSVRVKKFQCEHCTSAFTSKYTLKMHKEMKHDDNFSGESFICSVCNKEFNHRYAFTRHMYKHKLRNENVMYTCDMCKRNFVTKSSLTRHILEHNGKQFSCSHCGMLFTQPSSVKRHMLKLHSIDG